MIVAHDFYASFSSFAANMNWPIFKYLIFIRRWKKSHQKLEKYINTITGWSITRWWILKKTFFGARHVPFISSHKKGGNFDINNKVLHIEHTVNLYYHQQCSAGHLLCMVKCHCKCPLHVCIMARLSLLLAKEILSTFCLLSFWLPYFWNGKIRSFWCHFHAQSHIVLYIYMKHAWHSIRYR